MSYDTLQPSCEEVRLHSEVVKTWEFFNTYTDYSLPALLQYVFVVFFVRLLVQQTAGLKYAS